MMKLKDKIMNFIDLFVKDTTGSIMVLSALTFSFVAFCVLAISDVSIVVHNKIKIQQTADECSLAAATIEANAMSSIAWINEGMGYIYYYLMRYTVDNIVFAVAERSVEEGGDQPLGGEAAERYEQSYEMAAEWLPAGVGFLRDLWSLEHSISIVTPELMKRKIYEIADEAAVDSVNIFPEDFAMYPSLGGDFTLEIRKLSPNSWLINTPTLEYQIQIEKTGDNSFVITSNDRGEISSLSVNEVADNTWQIIYTSGGDTNTYTFSTVTDGNQTTWTLTSDTTNVTITEVEEMSYEINADGSMLYFRFNQEGGYWEQKDESGEWVPLEQAPEEIQVKDVGINVQDLSRLRIGDMYISIPPGAVWIDNIEITLSNPPLITGAIGPARFSITQEGDVIVNNLRSDVEIGEWKRYSQNDRMKHRLYEADDDFWIYNLVQLGSYLYDDNPYRFSVIHSLCDNDEQWATSRQLPEWAAAKDPITGDQNGGWFDPQTGASAGTTAYYQTWTCSVCGGSGCYEYINGEKVPLPPCYDTDLTGDGLTDVRTYQYETFGMNNPPYQWIPFFRKPLVLTRDFFKYGITIGIYKKSTVSLVGIFQHPTWGYFAFSSARAGMFDRDLNDYVFSFDDYDERGQWVDESIYNLYESTWEVRLFPIKDQIKQFDLDEEELGLEVLDVDNGTSFIYRMMRTGAWRGEYDGDWDYEPAQNLGEIYSPWNSNLRVDLYDDVIEDAVKH